MKNNIYAKVILSALFVGLNALVAFAEVPDLESKVARAAAEAALQRGENPYEVAISLHWKKEVTLGDMMMRAPRRPARKDKCFHHIQQFRCGGTGFHCLYRMTCCQNNSTCHQSAVPPLQGGRPPSHK